MTNTHWSTNSEYILIDMGREVYISSIYLVARVNHSTA